MTIDMDPHLSGFVDPSEGFEFDGQAIFASSEQFPNFGPGFEFDAYSALGLSAADRAFLPPDVNPGHVSPPSSSFNLDGDSSDDGEPSDSFLKYVSQVLMEENLEDKACMFHDPLALQAAEKSFYDALGGQNLTFRNPTSVPVGHAADTPDDCVSGTTSDYSSHGSPCNSISNSVNPRSSGDTGDSHCKSSFLQSPLPANYVFGSTLRSGSPSSSINSSDSFANIGSGVFVSSPDTVLFPNIFSDSESALQFKRGVEEASKFLPKVTNLVINLANDTLPPQSKVETQRLTVKTEEDEREKSPQWVPGRKNLRRLDTVTEGRSRKQQAIALEDEDDDELSEMFDKVLLCSDSKARPSYYCTGDEDLHNGICNTWQVYGDVQPPKGEKSRISKQSSEKEVVDLGTLLLQCAQAVSADDQRTAYELLKKIRQHSSPFGDGSQRLAHCFANGLEARLAGTGIEIYSILASKKVSATAMLKAYELFLAACPFKKISVFFSNHMILRLAEKAKVLHVIDFGILYGFQWPILIQRLSARPGGPPKLRITGIELPQPGFRPTERVEETGRRLAKYCERFKVPFEYNAIAQKWETVRVEDLKIGRDETIAVNCLFRSKNLPDETVFVDSPRNAVLALIRKINPHIFVHSIINGSYSAPFFVTRFREALFHFSAVFDVLDNNAPRGNEHRLMYEKEFCGQEVMNVIACEGSRRVERPETYKQWQVRTLKAGFRQLPLDRELTKKLKTKVKVGHHKDFLVDEDGEWLLQGWKGRVLYASSSWIPA